mmetsp:Transcript_21293/g.42220  ORF Transcript_21293/g.42220 Transcript_21293/m.42220 type:complete len:296 (-) Transcript_21293:80-967(-)
MSRQRKIRNRKKLPALTLLLFMLGSDGTTIHTHRPNHKLVGQLAGIFRKAPFNHAHYDAFLPLGGDAERESSTEAFEAPKGFKVIRISRELGSGEACYRRASEALLSWGMHNGCSHSGILVDKRPVSVGNDTPLTQRRRHGQQKQKRRRHGRGAPDHLHPTHHLLEGGGGGLVFTFAQSAPRIWSLNPCRITHQICDRPLARPDDGVSRSGSGGGAGMFSSVGYATLEGHWLKGAEVMTVRIDSSKDSGHVTFELVSISRGYGLFRPFILPLVARTQNAFFRDQADAMVRAAVAN